MPKTRVKFLQKPSCTSCRNAKSLLQKKGIELESRDIGRDPLSAEELDRLIGDRDYREFLNTRNVLYRERKMKEHPPSRSEALKLMAAEPNLIRRPIVIHGKEMILGFDAPKLSKLS